MSIAICGMPVPVVRLLGETLFKGKAQVVPCPDCGINRTQESVEYDRVVTAVCAQGPSCRCAHESQISVVDQISRSELLVELARSPRAIVTWSSTEEVWASALGLVKVPVFVCDRALLSDLAAGDIGRQVALGEDEFLNALLEPRSLRHIADEHHVGSRTLDREAARVYERYSVHSRHELLAKIVAEYLGLQPLREGTI